MTEQDRQLVELITNQVLAALKQQGVIGQSTPGPANPANVSNASILSTNLPGRVNIQPPIGQCTGDYSKFPELQGKLYGQANTQPYSPASANAPTNHAGPNISPAAFEPIALTGIITANQLQEAINASPDGTVLLAPDARLTPLANDLARQLKDKVRRGSASPSGMPGMAGLHGSSQQGAAGSVQASPWLWWIEGQCAAVHDVTRQMQGNLRPLAASPHGSALSQVVRDVASALKSRQIPGAFLFVPNASRAMCYANRCASIRAVVGTCGEAVEQGVTELGANVLVMEYPHQGPRAMAAMMQRMMQQPPGAPPAVERDLADLHRC